MISPLSFYLLAYSDVKARLIAAWSGHSGVQQMVIDEDVDQWRESEWKRTAITLLLFIIKSYTKYKIDRKAETENEKKKRKQHMQPGYNQTHTREQVDNIVTCKPDRQS